MHFNSNIKKIAWVMWLLTTFFFGFQFILRIIPGLIIHDIMNKFDVSAADYGYFSALYYLGYAGFQIPVAILLDRYGPKYIIFVCAFVCSISSMTIIYSDNWILSLLGRFFVGAGSAAGFLGVAKVLSIWFSPSQYARMVGLTFSLGLLGAVFGSAPISLVIESYGWEETVKFVGYGGIFVSLFILLTLKTMPDSLAEVEEGFLEKIKSIFANKYIVLLALSNFLLVGSLEGFADVWGVPYLQKTYNYTKTQASSITMLVYIGMLFGGPILAFFAEKFNAYFQMIAIAGLCMSVIILMLILFNGFFAYQILLIMMFVIGVCCCYQVIVLSLGSILSKPSHASLTIAFLNCINMLGGSMYHSLIGNLLNFLWDGTTYNGVNVYSDFAYNVAISVIPVIALIGVAINIWLSAKVQITTEEASER
ncbi:MAG: MFS transporter [Rickettsiales bacterium]